MEELKQDPCNPLAFLGLKRVGSDDSPVKHDNSDDVQLNRRGLPARKRKKNSLIFGGDEVVTLPQRSPKKKLPAKSPVKSPVKSPIKPPIKSPIKLPVKSPVKLVTKSPVKMLPVKSPTKAMPREEKKEEAALKPLSVRIPSNDVKMLARMELDSLVRNSSQGVSEDEPFSESESDADDFEDSYAEEDLRSEHEDYHSGEELLPDQLERDKEIENLSIQSRLNAQRLGVALRNLLKLPKAHKWVCFEFFYSNIDKVLFNGENDFMVYLRESFPQLKTRRLTRVEWCKVRRLMGKPRLCSSAFFREERQDLERKRQLIRTLQQRKVLDSQAVKDLPEEIPMQLTIGTKVTARLRVPQDGLFSGTVDAVDPSNSTYRIFFQRPGLGTHSIPDYEVLSEESPDLLPLTSYLSKPRLKPLASNLTFPSPVPIKYNPLHSPLTNDPLLSGSTPRTKSMRLDQILGGYPVRFLYHIVKLNKCLKTKRERVTGLKLLNTEAEKRKSFGANISEEFQKKYASTVLEVCKVNDDLNSYLKDVSQYTTQLGHQEGPTLSLPDQIRESCQEEGYDMVNRYNTTESPSNAATINSSNNTSNKSSTAPKTLVAGGDGAAVRLLSPAEATSSQPTVGNARLLALISQLSAVMLQVKRVADGERNAAEMQALKGSIDKIKSTLSQQNLKVFQDCVEVPMQHIQQGLSQVGNLTAFMKTETDQ